MTRALILIAAVWSAAALGHMALTTSLALPELTARAEQQARW